MLIEFMSTPVTLDSTPVLKDLRLNLLPDKRQFRLKFTEIHNGELGRNHDIVATQYKFGVDKLTAGITFSGKEMLTGNEFNIRVSYDLFKKNWRIRGTIGNREISTTSKNIQDVLTLLTLI